MDVLIVGAHGTIAQQLAGELQQRGDQVWGAIRKEEQRSELESADVKPVVVDLEADSAEDDLTRALHGLDAVVFAAGAGPDSGAERKWSVDHQGAVKTAAAAARADVRRIVVISSMGTDDPPEGDDVFEHYLRAKAQADAHVRQSGLDHTIVRPGGLTDDDPTGRVKAARQTGRGEIPRADVARVLAEVLHEDSAIGRTFELISGETAVSDAVAGLADQHDTKD